jgi:hypothetical protein
LLNFLKTEGSFPLPGIKIKFLAPGGKHQSQENKAVNNILTFNLTNY